MQACRGYISSCVTFADILDAEAVELCSLLFGTVLPFYTDLASQRTVERVLEKAVLRESFLKAFASSLVRIDGSHRSRQECFVLHKWISLALQALRLPTGLKAAQKLMDRQVNPVTCLPSFPPSMERDYCTAHIP